jgi:hypothetical protein
MLGAILNYDASRSGRWRDQFEGRGELQRLVKSSVQRAAHGVYTVYPFYCGFDVFRRHQAHGHVDSPDHQHILLCFDLAGNVGGQLSIAGIDLARFQRTSECTHHSTSGRGNDVVNG